FGLCWLALFAAGGRGGTFFPALLLIVTIRACVISGWPGRIPTAIAAYASFLAPVAVGLATAQSRVLQRAPVAFAEIEPTLFNLALNVALLYAFVLTFVLFLVSALLAERRSQQELARANQRLRDYARLAEDRATLQERNRIARELHDSIGHHLTAQSIQLENAAQFLPQEASNSNARAAAHLDTARQLGKAALTDIRRSVATLRARSGAAELAEPLALALEKLLQTAIDPDRCSLVRKIALSKEPAPPTAIALYRVVQEALTNIAKHAQASEIELHLSDRDGNIQLTIADNGCGFNPAENTTGFGLQSMRERIVALGGRFKLVSQPDYGCKIRVEVPDRPLMKTDNATHSTIIG
ncbi:MAG: sensor histidine kinase, partial [Cyanobacteria bacterium J06641_5]